MVVCSNCRKKEAKHQTAVNIDGRLVYMSLCDECLEKLQKKSQETSSLDQFSRDLTDLAKENKLDPVIGRDREIDRLIHVLCRRTKNNPVLIGEPGVGKTAIVEGLAQKISQNLVPEPMRNKRVVSLDLAALIAGTVHRGAFEKRLKEVLDEVILTKGQVILFIDEVHTIVGAGSAQGSMDASNILKPYLSRGEIQLIGATTIKEYKIIEKDAALERRFQQIMVDEPDFEHTKRILNGLRKRYEDHHKIIISQEAIEAAVRLSSRYISAKFQPDKAIDLIDEAGAALRLDLSAQEPGNLKKVLEEINYIQEEVGSETDSEKRLKIEEKLEDLNKVKKELTELWVQTKLENTPILTEEHVAKVISKMTGIPLSDLTQSERQKLKNLKEDLRERVIGQEEAIEVISQAIIRARAGVKAVNKPVGVFMFLGPTGVGKTQLAKSLAEVLYGSEDNLIRVDMSEFGEKHNVSRLIGSPPGYVGYEEGGTLTERVRRRPFSIVLFDEIEKAHAEVFNTLLQVMDDGRLTDGQGRTVDFRNTTIIMTSNVGSEFLKRQNIGFASEGITNLEDVELAHERIQERVNEALKGQFRPEFLNRIDDIVIFKPLSKENISRIVNIQISKLKNLLFESGISINLSIEAQNYLVENGYNIEMGARPLKRLIQKKIENPVSAMIISEDVKDGDEIYVSFSKDDSDLVVKVPKKVSADKMSD